MKEKQATANQGKTWKMRVSFDLDEVLFVSPQVHKTEAPLRFPWNRLYTERLRYGTRKLIRSLQEQGYEVWIYTSSYRTEKYIKRLFAHYGIRLDGIVNAQRHLREVQRQRKDMLPSKMPGFYRISLHVDDETVVASYGKKYGYNVYQLKAPDEEWAEKIIKRADQIRQTIST